MNMNIRLSIVIPAFNEELLIIHKLTDIFSTQTSPQYFEVLIGSDGSTDTTVLKTQQFAKSNPSFNIRIFSYSNAGKASTINKLLTESHGPIVLSTDADCEFNNSNILDHIINRFSTEPGLGGISSVPVLNSQGIETVYWKYENIVRSYLSKKKSLFVVSGMGFAFRKNAFVPIPPTIMADDIWIPLTILSKGLNVDTDPNFLCNTKIFHDHRELHRKIRVVKGGIHAVSIFFIQNPQMIFHPVFAYLVLFKGTKWLAWTIPCIFFAISLLMSYRFTFVIISVITFAIVISKKFRYLCAGLFVPLFALIQLLRNREISKWAHER